MRRLRIGALLLLASAVFPVSWTMASPACAGEGPRAALVVDTGEATMRYCVALPRSSVTGIDLIELAGEQHGLAYRLGFGGEAVCMLAGVGAEGEDCFGEYPDFWGYWRGAPDGGWSWADSGAGTTTVADGDVEGWSWGGGQDGATHPAPARTKFGSVCVVAKPPAAQVDPTPAAAEPPTDTGGEPASDKEKAPAPRPRERHRSTPQPTPSPAVSVTASPIAVALGSDSEPDGDGVPPAGLIAFGLTGLLVGSGWLVNRRRGRV